MAPEERTFNSDFRDLLAALLAAEVKFLVVGAHALSAHGHPRATGDLDLWVEPTAENAGRVWLALASFGAPAESLGVHADDFATPDVVVQIGIPPRRIDLLTSISGVSFAEAWPARVEIEVEGLRLPFLGRAELVRNKRATGRLQDLADLEALGEPSEG
jgi:hypothetical protein